MRRIFFTYFIGKNQSEAIQATTNYKFHIPTLPNIPRTCITIPVPDNESDDQFMRTLAGGV
jgi:hypothetical protein